MPPETRTKLPALLLLASLLVLNEWVLGWAFANDGSVGGIKLTLIRAYDVGALVFGLLLLRSGFSLGRLYRDTALVVFNVVVLLVVINVVAMAFSGHRADNLMIGGLEKLWQEPEVMYRIYGTRSHEEIEGRIRSPGASGHPSLQVMMRPSDTPWYRSGPEGSRVSCRDGQALDTPLDGAIWMFGGSTTYGTGVSDCETIASALNELDPGNSYVNFGVESRGQNPEIEHLLLLLRKGYRPKAVIFLDGLNDIAINALQTPGLHYLETPAIPQLPYYFFLANDRGGWVANLLARLPMMEYLGRKHVSGAPLPCGLDAGGVYTVGSDYHEQPSRHRAEQFEFENRMFVNERGAVSDEVYARCTERVHALYRDNSRFLSGLAQAFGFEYRVYFQPLTALMPGNPFLNPEHFDDSALRALLTHIRAAIAESVRNGDFPGFVDISSLGSECATCMVDANHYTREFGREIAAAMLARWNDAD
ncbi:MAG: hypothetical protein ACPGU7_00350 [Gammaproteobacteria bacterium]